VSVQSAQLYLCTDARITQGDFAEFIDAAYAGGVDVIQLRDKSIHASLELEYLEVLRAAAERNRKSWAVNDRGDLAALTHAPVFHVGQDDIPVAAARSLVGTDVSIGLSTHTPDQLEAALNSPALDYFCVGPVWATPTKPGRAAVGRELVALAAERARALGSARPWFAIGGIDLANMNEIVDAGARRIVVVRAITEASDPSDAAQRIRAALPPLV
jgi:thiamine-phosphate pyrophosphorylase